MRVTRVLLPRTLVPALLVLTLATVSVGAQVVGGQQARDSQVASASVFKVTGEVKKPGQYAWEAEMNVENALALAGGTTTYFSLRRSSIKRPVVTDEEGNVTKHLTIKAPALETLLLPGDQLVAGRKWMND